LEFPFYFSLKDQEKIITTNREYFKCILLLFVACDSSIAVKTTSNSEKNNLPISGVFCEGSVKISTRGGHSVPDLTAPLPPTNIHTPRQSEAG
jgi:hypothetical protein